MKQLKESTISDKNVSKDIEESARKVKNSKEAVAVVREMKKIIKSNKCSILWLAYLQDKIFQKFKSNDKFKNMANQFRVSNSIMVSEISIMRFLCNYPTFTFTF